MNNFLDLVMARQSDRAYEPGRKIEREVLERIIEAARMAPSACNGQPWHFTVITEEVLLKEVATATASLGMNKFAKDASALVLIDQHNLETGMRHKRQGLPHDGSWHRLGIHDAGSRSRRHRVVHTWMVRREKDKRAHRHPQGQAPDADSHIRLRSKAQTQKGA